MTNYNANTPLSISIDELSEKQKHLLLKSKTFCILPWIHIHAHDGKAYPCCMTGQRHSVGSSKDKPLSELWNSPAMREIRLNMLNDRPCKECTNCYEKEASGFVSVRNSSNKDMGHYVATVDDTEPDGTLVKFQMRYFDIRFNNLCNMKCRTCGPSFSSFHAQESKTLGWYKNKSIVTYAGRYEEDMWEQLQPHLDYVDRIYFAGGEPMIMEEHYRLLNALIERNRTDVRIVYNTNFSVLSYKDQSILDLWQHFGDKVSVGASLDASYARGELLRKGTIWETIVDNRKRMIKECPQVDFYVSSTLSAMNALHLPDFHREWVDLGLIEPQDWNINILQSPEHHRIDIFPSQIKEKIKEKYIEHINWLEPIDPLRRGVYGYKAAINFMMADDKSFLQQEFLSKIKLFDEIRGETFFGVFPELKEFAGIS